MESMGSFFGIVAIGAGIYCVYGYLLMIRRREIPRGIMLPRDTDPKKCRDVDAYIRMTSLPLICVAVLLLLYGALEMVNQYAFPVGPALFAALLLCAAALIWLAVRTKKANDTYF